MKKLYKAIHTHRHGTDVYLVRCNHVPTIDEVIKAHGINFEEDREDEWLDVEESDEPVGIP